MEQKIISLLLFYPVFLFSLSFHESAHGYMANRFGDPTAKLLGRITLNPIPHMDPIGTVVLPILGILTGAPIIGWGKPVPVNPWNFHDAKKGTLWVSALGPISNVFLAICFALIAWALVMIFPRIGASMSPGSFGVTFFSGAYQIAQMGVVLNLVLATFNLIPIPPLDGGGIIKDILPNHMLYHYEKIERYGMFIILALFITGALRLILYPVMVIASWLLPY